MACRAQLAEAGGDEAEAAVLYAEAAERWRGFGNVRERAYALLGQGRCLVGLGKREADPELLALNRTASELVLRALAPLAIVLIVIDMIYKPGA